MLTMLTTVVLAAATVSHALPAPGDVVIAFEVADRDGRASRIGGQRLSRSGEPIRYAADTAAVRPSSRVAETSPALCDDGQGGLLVAYECEFLEGERAGDHDIAAERVGADGARPWGKPKSIASSSGTERHPVVVSDGAGGVILVYEWSGGAGGADSDVLAQRIGGDGRCLWNGGAKPVVLGNSSPPERRACAITDGRGGAIVFFEWVGSDGDVDIMARRVTADGQVLWGDSTKALDVAATAGIEEHAVAVPDGAGGAVVVFETEPRSGDYKGDRDIAAQRVSSDGVLLWGGGKAVVVASGAGREQSPVALADGAGGVIVAYEYLPTTGEHAADTDVLAQRLGADGKMVWNAGERSVTVSSAPLAERSAAIVSDGAGGAIVACELGPLAVSDTSDVDIVAQRLDANGRMMWNEGKRSVGVSTSRWRARAPIALSDGQGGVIVVYAASAPPGPHEGDVDVEAARLDGAGKLTWNEGTSSVEIASTKRVERNPAAIVIGAR